MIANVGAAPASYYTQTLSLMTSSVRIVKELCVHFISPKQSVRPDSLWESIRAVLPNVQGLFILQAWKIYSVFTKTVPLKEADAYVQALHALKKQWEEPYELLSEQEVSKLAPFLFNQKIERFDLLIFSRGDSKFTQLHKTLGRLLQIQDTSFFTHFQMRLGKVVKVAAGEQGVALSEDEKLQVAECYLLEKASWLKGLVERLKKSGMAGLEELFRRLEILEIFSQSPAVNELRQLSLKTHPPGSIFIGDWKNYQAFSGMKYTCHRILEQLVMGNLAHIGINIKGQEGLSLSHMGSGPGKHSIDPVKYALILLFYRSLSLTIAPLLPKACREERLNQVFEEAFHKIASELHSELLIAQIKQHILLFLLGHKKIRASSLSEVDFPSAGTPTACSAYVGIVFLKAVQEVNKALELKGYKEQIAHPFGMHENIMHLDVLRLLYLWNRMKVVKEIEADPLLAKVMALPKPFLVTA